MNISSAQDFAVESEQVDCILKHAIETNKSLYIRYQYHIYICIICIFHMIIIIAQ